MNSRYELGCDKHIFTTLPNQDADKACVALAQRENAFGILTEDTGNLLCQPRFELVSLSIFADFLIHQTSPDIIIFSVKSLNLETLETIAYDRRKLNAKLGLTMKQLPLFATLKGNDYLPVETLRSFHFRIARNGRNGKLDNLQAVSSVALFVRQLGSKVDYKTLSQEIFGCRSKANNLKTSVDSYILSKSDMEYPFGTFSYDENDLKWSSLMEFHGNYNSKIFHLMTGAPYESSTCLEDYRNFEIPTVASLYSGVRKRLYGILFYEKKGSIDESNATFQMSVQEWCMSGFDSLERAQDVVPDMPPKDLHPGLEKLWQNRHYREFHGRGFAKEDPCFYTRWKLFAYIVDPKADSLFFHDVKDEDLYLICQLFIMQHSQRKPILTEFEVKAFILMHLRLKSMSDQELETMKMDFVPRPRPVQLATIYTRSILHTVSDCVGNVTARRNFCVATKFEGTLFHSIYKEQSKGIMSKVLTTSEAIDLNVFYQAVTSKGTKVRLKL